MKGVRGWVLERVFKPQSLCWHSLELHEQSPPAWAKTLIFLSPRKADLVRIAAPFRVTASLKTVPRGWGTPSHILHLLNKSKVGIAHPYGIIRVTGDNFRNNYVVQDVSHN